MITKPVLEQRGERPYAALPVKHPIPFGKVLGPSWDEVSAWLSQQDIRPSGPPFIRYRTTDMVRSLDLEIGYPIPALLPTDQRIKTGLIPAGIYAVMVYTGSVRGTGLIKATADLLDWFEENHHTLAQTTVDGETWWRARYEFYLTDPEVEPDMQKWQTELAFLVE